MATTLASAVGTLETEHHSASMPLHCRHCGGEIASDSRRVQCAHCGALFPFACLVCARNLRTPFPVFEDERYLTFPTQDAATGGMGEAKPLCSEHFLRHCPDCGRWFHAHENPGYFRCVKCGDAFDKAMAAPAFDDRPSEPFVAGGAPTLAPGASAFDANKVALASAGGALLGLVAWFILNRP